MNLGWCIWVNLSQQKVLGVFQLQSGSLLATDTCVTHEHVPIPVITSQDERKKERIWIL